jgi:hypothetical protein
MGRVSLRARHLHALLERHGYRAELEGGFHAPRPDVASMPDNLADETMAVYRDLAVHRLPRDGESFPTFRPDDWDLRVEGVLIELDEERHFNRYRGQTLRASAYERLEAFPLETFRAFCVQHESDCLAAATRSSRTSVAP